MTSLALLLVSVLAQTAGQGFDAAVIKPNKSNDRADVFLPMRNGRVRAQNVTLRTLLEEAHHLHPSQIDGPNWMESERYDVTANAEGNPGRKQMDLMLQGLLNEQFAIQSHWTSRVMPVYRLKLDRGGSKLKEAQRGCAVPSPCGGFSVRRRSEVSGHDVTMQDFASLLSWLLSRVVVDDTGLNGTYDIDLKWSPDALNGEANVPQDDGANGSVFSILREVLGLRLEAVRGPVRILVIDQARKLPEN